MADTNDNPFLREAYLKDKPVQLSLPDIFQPFRNSVSLTTPAPEQKVYEKKKVDYPKDSIEAKLNQQCTPATMQIASYRTDGTLSTASSVIVDSSGLVVTNFHVVDGKKTIYGKMEDGSGNSYKLKLLKVDREHDLAILKIEGDRKNYPNLKLAKDSNLKPGSGVWEFGYPGPSGNDTCVTSGVVPKYPVNEASKYQLLLEQKSNYGNSGSPEVNAKGEVVGVERAFPQKYVTADVNTRTGDTTFVKSDSKNLTKAPKDHVLVPLGLDLDTSRTMAVKVEYVRALLNSVQQTTPKSDVPVIQAHAYRTNSQLQLPAKHEGNAQPVAKTAAEYIKLAQQLGITDLNAAVTAYSNAIKLNPKDPDPYLARSVDYSLLSKPDLAMNDLNQAIKVNPKYERAYMARGFEYNLRGQRDLAIRDYNQAMKLNPKDDAPYIERSFQYSSLGRGDLALKDLDRSIKLNDRNYYSFSLRSHEYANKGERWLAIADLNKSLSCYPVAANYDSRAKVYGQLGYYDKEKNDLAMALKMEPTRERLLSYLQCLKRQALTSGEFDKNRKYDLQYNKIVSSSYD